MTKPNGVGVWVSRDGRTAVFTPDYVLLFTSNFETEARHDFDDDALNGDWKRVEPPVFGAPSKPRTFGMCLVTQPSWDESRWGFVYDGRFHTAVPAATTYALAELIVVPHADNDAAAVKLMTAAAR